MFCECFSNALQHSGKLFCARRLSIFPFSLSFSLQFSHSLHNFPLSYSNIMWRREREQKKVAHKYKSTTNNYTAHRNLWSGMTWESVREENFWEREREKARREFFRGPISCINSYIHLPNCEWMRGNRKKFFFLAAISLRSFISRLLREKRREREENWNLMNWSRIDGGEQCLIALRWKYERSMAR